MRTACEREETAQAMHCNKGRRRVRRLAAALPVPIALCLSLIVQCQRAGHVYSCDELLSVAIAHANLECKRKYGRSPFETDAATLTYNGEGYEVYTPLDSRREHGFDFSVHFDTGYAIRNVKVTNDSIDWAVKAREGSLASQIYDTAMYNQRKLYSLQDLRQVGDSTYRYRLHMASFDGKALMDNFNSKDYHVVCGYDTSIMEVSDSCIQLKRPGRTTLSVNGPVAEHDYVVRVSNALRLSFESDTLGMKDSDW